jgi:hypothetical protein
MIKPTYITFDQAKWLKEIEFDEITNTIFNTSYGTEVVLENINFLRHSDGNNPFISRPEHWEVIEWLRVNHNIDVEARLQFTSKVHKREYISYIDCVDIDYNKRYLTPQEAISAGFDYIKDNILIL